MYFLSILDLSELGKYVPRNSCDWSICRRYPIRGVPVQLFQLFYISALFLADFRAFMPVWVVFHFLELPVGCYVAQNPNP